MSNEGCCTKVFVHRQGRPHFKTLYNLLKDCHLFYIEHQGLYEKKKEAKELEVDKEKRTAEEIQAVKEKDDKVLEADKLNRGMVLSIQSSLESFKGALETTWYHMLMNNSMEPSMAEHLSNLTNLAPLNQTVTKLINSYDQLEAASKSRESESKVVEVDCNTD
jgi:hypothetical protein